MSLITRTEVAFLFLSGVQSNLLHPLRHSFGQCFSEISGRCVDEIIVPINRTQRIFCAGQLTEHSCPNQGWKFRILCRTIVIGTLPSRMSIS